MSRSPTLLSVVVLLLFLIGIQVARGEDKRSAVLGRDPVRFELQDAFDAADVTGRHALSCSALRGTGSVIVQPRASSACA